MSISKTIASFYDAITRQKDPTESAHGRQVARFSEEIARLLALPEEDIVLLKLGAHLHDIGKLTLPDSVLNKPGGLSQPERFMIEQHSQFGWEMLHAFQLGPIIEDVILHHHERYDGRGYPHRLKGDQITICAGIVHVADVYDALTSQRPYRQAPFSRSEAFHMIISEAGAYHPDVLEAFKETAKRLMYE